MLEEIGIAYTLTGTTVGIVSLLGFSPDVIGHLLSGWFVDTYDEPWVITIILLFWLV